MSNEEWGEWQIHDGKGCPVVGQWVEVVLLGKTPFAQGGGDQIASGEWVATVQGIAGQCLSNWDWRNYGVLLPIGRLATKVIRYRVRKPRGLTMLENLVASLDAPEGPAKTPRKVEVYE